MISAEPAARRPGGDFSGVGSQREGDAPLLRKSERRSQRFVPPPLGSHRVLAASVRLKPLVQLLAEASRVSASVFRKLPVIRSASS